MNKFIYWFFVFLMLFNYLIYYLLFPFVWLQGKIADFNNNIDNKLVEDKLGIKMQTFVQTNKKK